MTSDTSHNSSGQPLSHSEHEKRLLERDAARLFMRRYEQETGQPMRHIWHNEPAKPDISCYFEDHQLDLEIAHLYATAEEARHIRAPDRTDRLWFYLAELAIIDDPCEQLKMALLTLLNKKAEKHYDSDRVWLVIRNASVLWNRAQILRIQQAFDKQNHPFEQIWIIPDFDGEEPLIRVA
ncbi:hypothetical protein [Oceanospirillum sediminis]|uniref:Uncharacterized protein n=1 Tax=Oceanospirillum sediminis TaxID=2760088 RepID=A0A839IXQ4_9GAMM|nr:hypothetical protein [Oceanospirillum sediminis]MBB1489157.1 hypothetical protein [Oceanospirillum sediminis]